jgi:hypothetical protein
MLKERPGSPIDVTVVGTTRAHEGLRVHRVRELPRRDVQRHRGIRMTTPKRTLLDLAGVLSIRELERAVAEAFALGLVRERALMRYVDERAGARGARLLRHVLEGSPARLGSAEAPRAALSNPRHLLHGIVLDLNSCRDHSGRRIADSAGSPRTFNAKDLTVQW